MTRLIARRALCIILALAMVSGVLTLGPPGPPSTVVSAAAKTTRDVNGTYSGKRLVSAANRKTVTLKKTITIINKGAFRKCSKLGTLNIHATKKVSVNKKAFRGLSKKQRRTIQVRVNKKMSGKRFRSLKKALRKAGIRKDNIRRAKMGAYYSHDIEAYLLIGTDSSQFDRTRKTGKYSGFMADFQTVFIMDKTSKRYGFFQLNRDTVTDVRMLYDDGTVIGWDKMWLCTSGCYGRNLKESCRNTVATASAFLDEFPIDGYYSIHFDEVRTLNHIVGGVRLTIPEDMTKVDPAFRKGVTLTLTDSQAEQFVRARMSMRDDRNSQRMRRQRVFMTAFQNQVIRQASGDPAVFLKLYRRMSKKGVTNISAKKMAEISTFVYRNKSRGILTYSGKDKLGKLDYDPTPHNMFIPNRKSIRKGLNTLCGVKR